MQNEQIQISQWMVDSLLSANAERAGAIIQKVGAVFGPKSQEKLVAAILRQVHSA
ncbi:MAG: hypothetical protein KIG16_01775 [Eubacteriales bacterium]|nr:hypothetical protein [Eubacteriales bacterium]